VNWIQFTFHVLRFIPMPSYQIPLDLDLTAVPARAVEIAVPVDLPLLIAHTGEERPLDLEHLSARLPDGRPLPAQYLPGSGDTMAQVFLSLPADVAALNGARVTLLAAPQEGRATGGRTPRVVFSQGPDSVELLIDGARFAVYRYNTTDPDLPRPYFHPITGPAGVPITQEGEIPGTKQAHFHHTGLVLAHQNFTDGNNWQIGPNFSRMRHLAFDVMQSGPVQGRFVQRLEWPSAKGDRIVFRETRTVVLPARDAKSRCLDIDTTLTCADQPATWNATPYHLLAIRVPDAMVVDRGGVITNSEGKTNNATAGAPARWLDFSGPLGGSTCGVTIMDHPQNLRHPVPWLNFENETVGAAPTYKEPYTWKPGEAQRFRYRVYFHTGDVKAGNVAQEYEAYITAPKARIGPPARLS
jgi:methane monooxygenase PmoA-like